MNLIPGIPETKTYGPATPDMLFFTYPLHKEDTHVKVGYLTLMVSTVPVIDSAGNRVYAPDVFELVLDEEK